jgi:hypothetical protein
MDANTDMNFDVLKDEMQLYLLGVIDEDELLIVLNNKRKSYGLGELKKLPEKLMKLSKTTEKAVDMAISQLEDMFQ